MTDIVERLRAAPCDTRPKYDFQGRDIGGDHPDLHEQAADEIERLRSALERIAADGTNVAMHLQQIARVVILTLSKTRPLTEALKDD
jgi:hypothetical protein